MSQNVKGLWDETFHFYFFFQWYWKWILCRNLIGPKFPGVINVFWVFHSTTRLKEESAGSNILETETHAHYVQTCGLNAHTHTVHSHTKCK